ncbi:MAG: hypothetical protein O7161_07330, partial [Wolbachia endosymbiont of Halictus tumulorum]|nr:hypothetical protein [Wolbachia endosymbiont of Halictus tumulorum]
LFRKILVALHKSLILVLTTSILLSVNSCLSDQILSFTTKLCNINSEDLQPICENSEKAQIETTVEPTSVDRADSPSSAEPCFDATDEKDKPLTQQRQAILAGVVGAVLLASGVALYIMKMPVVAAVVGIVGLSCVSYALYDVLKPNTTLEKVESVEQPIQSSLNLT